MNGVFLDVICVALARTDVSEELIASDMWMKGLCALGTLAVTSN
jgi:hypothetical protein